MQLFNVAAWKNPKHKRDEIPEWETEILAESVEEAYRKGKELFKTERPSLSMETFTFEASY